jgi:membrane protein
MRMSPTKRSVSSSSPAGPSGRTDRPAQAHHRPGFLRRFGRVTYRAAAAYFSDNISRLGAALAFYTTVAVAPLLMLAIALAGFVFNDHSARDRVLREIQQLVGADAERALEAVRPLTGGQSTAVFAAWIGFGTLLIGGIGVFVHLQDALNAIWHSPAHSGETWRAMVKRRLFSFGTVVMTGFIMLVSLIVSALLTWIGEDAHRWTIPPGLFEALNFVGSLGVITLLFAVIFKLLPDVTVRWHDVWVGAIVTALLFVAGKTVLGIYLAHASLMSSYGAAGSLIALLLWCYYAAQILFFGAEFTRIHALTNGGRDDPPEET